MVLINGLGSSNLHDIMAFGKNTRACGLVWSMLVRLGRTDSGSNPGRPTTICISSLQLYQKVSPKRTHAIFLWNYSSLTPLSAIMRYKAIMDSNISKLNEKVQQMIDNGWICQGGASVSGPYSQGVFVQSMVKVETPHEERDRIEAYEDAKDE